MTTDNNSLTPTDNLNLFTAAHLLSDTPILEQVLKLRDELSRESDGILIDYDDMGKRIKAEIANLPTLELQMDIPSGQEGAYQRQLLFALGQINDDHDRTLRRVIKLKSRLLNAVDLMKSQRAQFGAFYALAVPVAIHGGTLPPDQKLTPAHIKEMANSEFSNLMDRLDYLAPSLISELKILEVEIKQRKVAQADKYALGKDQVNAMWNSIQSNGAIGLDDDAGGLVKRTPLEEDTDEIPSYVSQHTKESRVAANESYVKKPCDTYCSKCGEKQFNTPSGDTCPNGHGGAEGVYKRAKLLSLEELEAALNGEDSTPVVINADGTVTPIKGTFVKTGDPKPITPIVDEGGGEAIIEKLTELEDAPTWVRKPSVITVPDDVSKEEIQWTAERMKELAESEPKTLIVEPQEPTGEPVALPAEHVCEAGTIHLDAEMEARFVNEPTESVTIEYEANWEESDTTKELLIEDVPDPVPTPRLVLPEGAQIVEDLESIVNTPEPLATQAPATPRKKLILDDEDII